MQSLTPQGARAMYFLMKNVGGLLDEFGVKWWMSSGVNCLSFQPDSAVSAAC